MSRGDVRRRIRIAAVAAVVVAVAGLGLAACVLPSPNAGISCAWPTKADAATLNVAYPDANATYFTTRYQLANDQQLVISGSYPFARYMNFVTYGLTGSAVDSIADTQIAPDAGSDNPFTNAAASANPSQRRYTVRVAGAGFPGLGLGANTLAASSSPGGMVNGVVILRVYVPDTAGAITGGVPLPTISVRSGDGSVTSLPTCPTQGADTSVVDLISSFGPATDQPALVPPVFKRPAQVGGLFPNPDNGYVAAVTAHTPGQVVVVTGKAPTTPDTEAGQSVTNPTDLRYWSICQNEYRKPYPVTGCAYDRQVPVDASGNYAVVISTAVDRPANATEANGVAWLDWGSTAVNAVVLFRHMLPAASFTQSVFAVAPGQAASPAMGAYAPRAAYCPSSTFAAAPTASAALAACGL